MSSYQPLQCAHINKQHCIRNEKITFLQISHCSLWTRSCTIIYFTHQHRLSLILLITIRINLNCRLQEYLSVKPHYKVYIDINTGTYVPPTYKKKGQQKKIPTDYPRSSNQPSPESQKQHLKRGSLVPTTLPPPKKVPLVPTDLQKKRKKYKKRKEKI